MIRGGGYEATNELKQFPGVKGLRMRMPQEGGAGMNCANCGYCHGTAIEACIAVAECRGAERAWSAIEKALTPRFTTQELLTLKDLAKGVRR